ncbi:hypothetical protein M2352_000730 [Azospirillum fermentarium]|uniref:hypothetical protein n=1 Tax=Azospirillum fermentarium TaxID=1233114 RepID=UPI002226A65D|nr:hypothetical protein [Azospirillum fermentarium]MCW2245139.1 hypothetical protein [Azospirillum fermentarium]
MRNDHREFYVYDLEIGVRKAGAKVPDMETVVSVWDKLSRANRCHPIQSGNMTLLIGQVEINRENNVATILVRLSNKLAPNSVYSDPTTGDFNEHIKTENQGSDFACHVLVSTIQEENKPNVYTCIIERVAGLTPNLAQRVLSKFLNFEFHEDTTSFQYRSPGGGLDRAGQPRMERCCPHIELRGRPSDSLVRDINNGRIHGISLVKVEQNTPIAGAAFLTKESSELKLGIDRGNLPANLWDNLRTAFQRNAGSYQQAKIRLEMDGTKRSVTVDIDAQTGAPLRDLYIKSFEITDIRPLLAQSARQIVPHLRDHAIPRLLEHRTV